jgi:hypothetical protein
MALSSLPPPNGADDVVNGTVRGRQIILYQEARSVWHLNLNLDGVKEVDPS